MTKAFSEKELDIAQDLLGEAVEYAVEVLQLDADFFLDLFIRSGYAEQYERGNPRVLFGWSGTELADHVLMESELDFPGGPPVRSKEYSPWYWAGWILAFYQWESGLPFSRIREFLPLGDIVLMYHPLHEAPEEAFRDVAEKRRREAFRRGLRLKTLRTAAGLSQRELAERSGVGIRAIQQYEQGAKRIEMASGRTLYNLSYILRCHMEDLLDLPVE